MKDGIEGKIRQNNESKQTFGLFRRGDSYLVLMTLVIQGCARFLSDFHSLTALGYCEYVAESRSTTQTETEKEVTSEQMMFTKHK